MIVGGDVLRTLWRRRYTLASTFLLVLGAAIALTVALPKAYTARAYVLVSPVRAPGSDFEATQATQVLTRTYAELLQGAAVAAVVEEELGRDDARTAVKVIPVPQSRLLAVEATDGSPAGARRLADGAAMVYTSSSPDVPAGTSFGGRLSVAQRAALPEEPSRPRPALYLALGTLLAGGLAVLLTLVRHRLDPRAHVARAATQAWGVPVLGRLPRQSRGAGDDPAHAILANLTLLGGQPATLAVASVGPARRRAQLAARLVSAAAERGLDVLLVETDFREPVLARLLLSRESGEGDGLADVLKRSHGRLEDRIEPLPGPGGWLLPAGRLATSPAGLLTDERLEQLQAAATERFELTVYEAPRLNDAPEAPSVISLAQVVVLLVAQDVDRADEVEGAVARLKTLALHRIGLVVDEGGDAWQPVAALPGEQRPLPDALRP
jgi:capsular polysaccharide biosynthesis protein